MTDDPHSRAAIVADIITQARLRNEGQPVKGPADIPAKDPEPCQLCGAKMKTHHQVCKDCSIDTQRRWARGGYPIPYHMFLEGEITGQIRFGVLNR